MGLSEAEFWGSTLAKVDALYKVKVLEWDQRRDYFVASHLAAVYNAQRTKAEDHVFTGAELLGLQYPVKPPPVIITSDSKGSDGPERGARGDWQMLKSGLQGVTDAARQKKAQRKVHYGK